MGTPIDDHPSEIAHPELETSHTEMGESPHQPVRQRRSRQGAATFAMLKHRWPAAAVVVVLVVGLGGVAGAALVAGSVVTTCINREGTVRVVDSETTSCPGSQTRVRLAGVDDSGRVNDSNHLAGNTLDQVRAGIDADTVDGKDASELSGATGFHVSVPQGGPVASEFPLGNSISLFFFCGGESNPVARFSAVSPSVEGNDIQVSGTLSARRAFGDPELVPLISNATQGFEGQSSIAFGLNVIARVRPLNAPPRRYVRVELAGEYADPCTFSGIISHPGQG